MVEVGHDLIPKPFDQVEKLSAGPISEFQAQS